jgi:hypothetical protein
MMLVVVRKISEHRSKSILMEVDIASALDLLATWEIPMKKRWTTLSSYT